MMKLFFLVFFSTFFYIQLKSVYCDLIDGAKVQAENLEILINVTRRVVKDTVSEQYLGIMYSGMYAEERGQISIQNQKILVEGQITSIKTLSETSGIDISFCLLNYEENLKTLSEEIYDSLASCIDGRISESSAALRRSDNLVDKFYTRIQDLMLQIDLCKTDSCISPIIDFMNSQETLMPQKIKLEVTRNRDLYDILVVAMNECQENYVADYSFTTTLIINDIEDCANALLG